MTADNGVARMLFEYGDIAMKIIASVLVVLSVLAGVAAPASALDARSFYDHMDRQSGGN
jgi:hypothetical protein